MSKRKYELGTIVKIIGCKKPSYFTERELKNLLGEIQESKSLDKVGIIRFNKDLKIRKNFQVIYVYSFFLSYKKATEREKFLYHIYGSRVLQDEQI